MYVGILAKGKYEREKCTLSPFPAMAMKICWVFIVILLIFFHCGVLFFFKPEYHSSVKFKFFLWELDLK